MINRPIFNKQITNVIAVANDNQTWVRFNADSREASNQQELVLSTYLLSTRHQCEASTWRHDAHFATAVRAVVKVGWH